MAKKKENKSIEELLKEALITKEEQPYEIPSNWEWVRLGSVATQIRGVSYKKDSECNEKDGNATILRGGNIQNGKIKFFVDDTYISKELVNGIQYLKKGDIVLVGSTGSKHLIGKAASVIEDMEDVSFGAFLKLIRSNKVEMNYLGNYFQSNLYKQEIQNVSKGININNITNGHIDELSFPLPPLSEQKRIVIKLESMLSKIKEAKEKIAEATESFELRRASILHKAFTGELTRQWREEKAVNNEELTVNSLLEKINEEKIKAWEEECKKAELEGKKKPSKPKLKMVEEMKISDDEKPYDLPQGWEWMRLGDVTHLITDGKHGDCNNENHSGYYFLSAKSIQNEKLIYDGAREIPYNEFLEVHRRTNLEPGDICMVNTGATVGKLAIAEENQYTPKTTFQKSVAIIKPCKLNINSYYMKSYLLSMVKSLRKISGGSAINNLLLKDMKNILIPIPSFVEQKEIARMVEIMFKVEDEAKDLLNMEEQIDLLEKSILSKAFRGELGTNDTSDETAMELLKRVLGE